MKKTLLLAAALLAMTGAQAADWTYQWGHVIDAPTTSGDSPISLQKLTDGNYAACYNWGTTTTDNSLSIDSDKVTGADGQAIKGQNYVGTSCNRNIGVTKFDASLGTPLWTVYSNMGDVEHSYTNLVATNDGGMILVTLVRGFADKETDTLVNIVSADGTSTAVLYTPNTNGATYKTVIAKINGAGKVQWAKMAIDADHYSAAAQKFAPEPVYTSGVALDESGNIYIAGCYRTTIKFINGTDTTSLVATNTDGYDGSIQTVVGDLFLAKFDANGNYVSNLNYTSDSRLAQYGGGNSTMSQFDQVVVNGNVAYVLGRANLTGTGNFQDMILASVNTADMSVNYVNAIKATAFTDGKHTTQVKGMQLQGGKLYLTGLVKGGFVSGDYTIASGTKSLEGFVVKCNPADGAVEGMAIDGDYISGYFGVVETTDSLVAFGYNMASGVIAVSYDKNLTAQGTTKVMVKGGTIAAMAAPVAEENGVVVLNRNKGNKDASFYGTDVTLKAASTTWDVNISKFSNEDVIPSAVTDLTVNKAAQSNDVYNIWGQKVDGNNLPSGIYIKAGKKIVVK